MRGSSGSQTVTQTSDPWSQQQPYLQAGFDQSKQLYESSFPQYFPNAGYVPFSSETEQSLQMGANRARQGSPVLQGAQGMIGDTMSGKFLEQGNPYTSGVVSKLDSAIRPQVQSMFASAGGKGGSFNETDAYTRAMADATAPYLFQDYGNERGRMMQGANLAPALAAADYVDPAQLGQIGATREQLGERQLTDAINRWNFGQNRPGQKLQEYMGNIRGNYGGTQQTTQPIYRNPIGGAIGGAASGAGLGLALQQAGMMGQGSPWMWPLVAGGGLLGAF